MPLLAKEQRLAAWKAMGRVTRERSYLHSSLIGVTQTTPGTLVNGMLVLFHYPLTYESRA